jgi:hypothetical protein
MNISARTTPPPYTPTRISLAPGVTVPHDDILFVFRACSRPGKLSPTEWNRYWDIIDQYRQAVDTTPLQEVV